MSLSYLFLLWILFCSHFFFYIYIFTFPYVHFLFYAYLLSLSLSFSLSFFHFSFQFHTGKALFKIPLPISYLALTFPNASWTASEIGTSCNMFTSCLKAPPTKPHLQTLHSVMSRPFSKTLIMVPWHCSHSLWLLSDLVDSFLLISVVDYYQSNIV